MAQIAFLFPGQGSQSTGMGKLLAEQYPIARETFERADDALGVSLSRLCFEGPDAELKKTENTQPALLAVSVAAWRVLGEAAGYHAGIVAGHSLGEYSALVAAGALEFEEALRLVRKRGRYMQEAVPLGVGAMAALLKLPAGELDGVLAEAAQGEIVTAANLNSPDQIVIAGHADAVARAGEVASSSAARSPGSRRAGHATGEIGWRQEGRSPSGQCPVPLPSDETCTATPQAGSGRREF